MNKNYVTIYVWNEILNSNVVKIFSLEEFDTLKRSDIKISDAELSSVIKLDIPKGVVKICDGILNKCNLVELKMPTSVRKIENNNLFLNFYLTSLSIPIEVNDFNWDDYFYRMFFSENKVSDFNLTLYYEDEKELLWYLRSFLKVKKKEVFLANHRDEFAKRFNLVIQGPTLSTIRRERIEKMLLLHEINNYDFVIEKKKRAYKTKCRTKKIHP